MKAFLIEQSLVLYGESERAARLALIARIAAPYSDDGNAIGPFKLVEREDGEPGEYDGPDEVDYDAVSSQEIHERTAEQQDALRGGR